MEARIGRQGTRSRAGAFYASLAGLLLVLFLAPPAYWEDVNSVPAFAPQLPAPPRVNGYERAERAARRMQALGLRVPPSWPDGTPAELEPLLRRLRPHLAEARAALREEWRAPDPLANPSRET